MAPRFSLDEIQTPSVGFQPCAVWACCPPLTFPFRPRALAVLAPTSLKGSKVLEWAFSLPAAPSSRTHPSAPCFCLRLSSVVRSSSGMGGLVQRSPQELAFLVLWGRAECPTVGVSRCPSYPTHPVSTAPAFTLPGQHTPLGTGTVSNSRWGRLEALKCWFHKRVSE